MKKIILSFFTLFVFHFAVLADQLAYLSKTDAERAAVFLEKQKKSVSIVDAAIMTRWLLLK